MEFWPLQTLKIELPPRREHDFYKIEVFSFVAKFGPKMIGFEGPKSMQNQKFTFTHWETFFSNFNLIIF